MWDYKGPRIYKTMLKRNKLEGLQYLTPRLTKGTSNQSCVALVEDTQLKQLNTRKPRNRPPLIHSLDFGKGNKAISGGHKNAPFRSPAGGSILD